MFVDVGLLSTLKGIDNAVGLRLLYISNCIIIMLNDWCLCLFFSFMNIVTGNLPICIL